MARQIVSGPLAGRTVLITGATSGIGRATALGLARLGAHLAITGRDSVRTEDAAREIRTAGGGQLELFAADLSSQSEVRRLANEEPSYDEAAAARLWQVSGDLVGLTMAADTPTRPPLVPKS
jgi:NAD(P)-dependent dehydrogenase (short-subunit alcohol dehydrogenase family)